MVKNRDHLTLMLIDSILFSLYYLRVMKLRVFKTFSSEILWTPSFWVFRVKLTTSINSREF